MAEQTSANNPVFSAVAIESTHTQEQIVSVVDKIHDATTHRPRFFAISIKIESTNTELSQKECVKASKDWKLDHTTVYQKIAIETVQNQDFDPTEEK